jgi:uncharacterized membrane protein
LNLSNPSLNPKTFLNETNLYFDDMKYYIALAIFLIFSACAHKTKEQEAQEVKVVNFAETGLKTFCAKIEKSLAHVTHGVSK